MNRILIVTVGVAAIAMTTSCSLMQPKPTTPMPVQCIIETDTPGILVEVILDGKIIFNGKTKQQKEENLDRCDFAVSPGDHLLSICAAGYETWSKQITVVGGGNRFWAKLTKKP